MKISHFIGFPSSLQLNKFSEGNHEANYDLYAVLIHSGYGCNSGHYYCYVKNSDGMWYQMNDSQVRMVKKEEVMQSQAYILFYSRTDQEQKSRKNSDA